MSDTRYPTLAAVIVLLGTSLLGTSLLGTSAVASAEPRHRPSSYVVSEQPGDNPEGIEITPDGTIYVTARRTGAVFRGHVRNPRLEPYLPAGQDGRTAATGVHEDRFGRLFVAGATTGTLYVYDRTGRLLAARRAPTTADSLLNDFAFTDDAVYVTDSRSGTVWRAPVSPWHVGELRPFVTADRFPVPPTVLNGIVAVPGGRALLIADWITGALYRVELRDRTVRTVDLGGAQFTADGMLSQGRLVYGVVHEELPDGSWEFFVRALRLNADFTSGAVIGDSARVTEADVPTTMARDRDRLLWVNSRLTDPLGPPPFTITEVPSAPRTALVVG